MFRILLIVFCVSFVASKSLFAASSTVSILKGEFGETDFWIAQLDLNSGAFTIDPKGNLKSTDKITKQPFWIKIEEGLYEPELELSPGKGESGKVGSEIVSLFHEKGAYKGSKNYESYLKYYLTNQSQQPPKSEELVKWLKKSEPKVIIKSEHLKLRRILDKNEDWIVLPVQYTNKPAKIALKFSNIVVGEKTPALLIQDGNSLKAILGDNKFISWGINNFPSNQEFDLIDLGDPVLIAKEYGVSDTSATVIFGMNGIENAEKPYVLFPRSKAMIHYPAQTQPTTLSIDLRSTSEQIAMAACPDNVESGKKPAYCDRSPFRGAATTAELLLDGLLPKSNLITKKYSATVVPEWLRQRLESKAWIAKYCQVRHSGSEATYGKFESEWHPSKTAILSLDGNISLAGLFSTTCEPSTLDFSHLLPLSLESKERPFCLNGHDDSYATSLPDGTSAFSSFTDKVLSKKSSRFVQLPGTSRYIMHSEVSLDDWSSFLGSRGSVGCTELYNKDLAYWMKPSSAGCMTPIDTLVVTGNEVSFSSQSSGAASEVRPVERLAQFYAFQYFFGAVSKNIKSLSTDDKKDFSDQRIDFTQFRKHCLTSAPNLNESQRNMCRLRTYLTLNAMEMYAELAGSEDLGWKSDSGSEELDLASGKLNLGVNAVCSAEQSGSFRANNKAQGLCKSLKSYWEGIVANHDSGIADFYSHPVSSVSKENVSEFMKWVATRNQCDSDMISLPTVDELTRSSILPPKAPEFTKLFHENAKKIRGGRVGFTAFSLVNAIPDVGQDFKYIPENKKFERVFGALTGLAERTSDEKKYGFAAGTWRKGPGSNLNLYKWRTGLAFDSTYLNQGDPNTGFRLVFEANMSK